VRAEPSDEISSQWRKRVKRVQLGLHEE